MNCRDVNELVHAYVDDELDLVSARQVDEHLVLCGGCRGRLETVRAVKGAVANSGQYFKAPVELRARVLGAILEKDQTVSTNAITPDLSRRERGKEGAYRSSWRSWGLAVAAVVVLAVMLSLTFRGGQENPIVAEVLTAHLRSMQAGHLMDVVSTDQHTVKPWFDSRVDFSPPVKQLEAAGFPLLGGRLDYLGNRPVAALIYGRAKHTINLFVWPGEGGSGATERRGFNVVHWTAGGMTFWAVSDLNARELEQFAELVRNDSGPTTTVTH
jgi:anti-sigma factor RsiW